MSKNFKTHGGFTLIELLVVISILGLLSSILLVALNSARTKNRDMYRIATLNQVAKALEFYYNKYNKYPSVHNCAMTNSVPNPPCMDDSTGIGEYTDRNWNDVITLLRNERFLAEAETPQQPWYKKIVAPFAIAASNSRLQDPKYPQNYFGYMVSINPQNYRIRTKLENLNHPIIKSGIPGNFIHSDPADSVGPSACDKSLGFYCIGPGGTYQPYIPGKPVIYLYPTTTTEVTVQVNRIKITDSVPPYGEGWKVIASPDGNILNLADSKTYPYLFWEGESSEPKVDTSKGFVVESAKVEQFLREKLAMQGLKSNEAEEFIEYWAPRMKDGKYTYVYFMPQADYDHLVPLSVTPKPDTIIRVYMLFKQLDEPIEVEEQHLTAPQRQGFTVVEWGGDRREIW